MINKKIRILHTADNHLDPKLRMFGSKVYERKKDFIDRFEQIVHYALKRKPDILLISGDLFDSVNPRNPTRTSVIRMLRALRNAGIRIFAIAGNHDAPKSLEEGMSPLNELEAAGIITFFSETKTADAQHLRINGYDVCISGMSYDHSLSIDDVVDISRLPTEGDINIAMLHYNVDILDVKGVWRAPMIRKKDVPSDINYLALGHLHSHQEIRIGRTLAVYPGSTERRNFSEEKDPDKGFIWVEIDSRGNVKTNFIKLETRPMRTININVSDGKNIEEIIIKSLDNIPYNSKAIVRVRITGKLPLEALIQYRRKDILKILEEKFFYVILDDTNLNFTSIKEEPNTHEISLSPIEIFREYINASLEKADNELSEILKRAYKFGEKALREVGAW